MDVSHALKLASIKELKILSNVRLINRHDLNSLNSQENLHVQFALSGEVQGSMTCYLCLDHHKLTQTDKNYIFPLFVESMNILVGKQLSLNQQLKIRLSPPRLSMISQLINTSEKSGMQHYDLQLDGQTFSVLTESTIEILN